MRVVALLTCHNRKSLTLRCLESLFAQKFHDRAARLDAIVVDDGSTDATGAAVRAAFPRARVVDADGTLFWARGMQLAEAHAVVDRPEFLLWLNDDVVLEEDALERLLTASIACPDSIVVGALVDPETRATTYSGVARSWWHPLRTRLVEPGDRPIEADTFNGNVVFVPRTVYEHVGTIDGRFAHGQADYDYGFRARRAGFRVVVAPGACGICRRGSQEGTFEDANLPLRRRWQLVRSNMGLPMRSHARYLRRHGGPLWPLFWLMPYVKLTLGAIATAPARRRARRT